MDRRERAGILAGIASSALGGMAGAVTRFAVVTVDPVIVATFRFALGCVLLGVVATYKKVRWPRKEDLAWTLGLGIMFYGGCFVAYAYALTFTTAARGALGVSTLPVLTMVVAAALGREPLTKRKSTGVLIALIGVAMSLGSGLQSAPSGAWRGDLIMIAAMLSMSLYTIYSRQLMARSSALGYACVGMAAGAGVNLAVVSTGGWALFTSFATAEWAALIFLGVFPGAVGFFLWVYAVERTTPTRVASTITVNPISAGALAALLLGEPFGMGLLAGVTAVGIGIWIASTESRLVR